ncbi:Phospholipase_D-nuclease N-terminal [Nonlabens sp. Hel1_33_55]|uniref:PLDc N-terminal domain-containing protein n=1 Tax=Nonlabens sp. Hel1_33_55 TaxID=1336802 RepID=UPI000875C60A|nr:PLDc N-terminal domain-containing protein [Nonlabens sp. Hel1_33_55]SCY31304.1 Phospholipase_D-nuclease N-terminal [Nonlabens sp. Hel1_33_55]
MDGFFPASLFVFLGLFLMGLWVYCIIDIARSTFRKDDNKLIYILVVVLAPVIGILLYLAIWQKEKVTLPRDI